MFSSINESFKPKYLMIVFCAQIVLICKVNLIRQLHIGIITIYVDICPCQTNTSTLLTRVNMI